MVGDTANIKSITVVNGNDDNTFFALEKFSGELYRFQYIEENKQIFVTTECPQTNKINGSYQILLATVAIPEL